MAVTITAAGLVAAYPEWAAANTSQPAVIAHVIAVANAKVLTLYTNTDEETARRYLEAGALLFDHPFGRDMAKYDPSQNWYRLEATRRDRLKGTAYRAPGWTIPPEVS